MSTLDNHGNLHDRAGKFAGHRQSEPDVDQVLAATTPLPQPALTLDLHQRLRDWAGALDVDNPLDINQLADDLDGILELRCIWDRKVHNHFDGRSLIVARTPGGPWRRLSRQFGRYLRHGDHTDPVPADLLADRPFRTRLSLDNPAGDDGIHLAREHRWTRPGIDPMLP